MVQKENIKVTNGMMRWTMEDGVEGPYAQVDLFNATDYRVVEINWYDDARGALHRLTHHGLTRVEAVRMLKTLEDAFLDEGYSFVNDYVIGRRNGDKWDYDRFEDLMDDIDLLLGDCADDYDVYAIADQISEGVGDSCHIRADISSDYFWTSVEHNHLTEDWQGCVDLPQGIDDDVYHAIAACTYVVRRSPSADLGGVFGWCRRMREIDRGIHEPDEVTNYYVCAHLIGRARLMTQLYRVNDSALDIEDRLQQQWWDARWLCWAKGVDHTDSAHMVRALAAVAGPDWIGDYSYNMLTNDFGVFDKYEI